MTISSQWSLTTLKDYDSNVKIALIPLPNPLGESKVVISIDTSFCIFSSTKYPDECLKFLDFLSHPENAQTYTDIEGRPNVVNGVVLNGPELSYINDVVANSQVCISQNAIWPSGFRKALGSVATDLIIDGDLDAFYEAAAEVIDEYYNN